VITAAPEDRREEGVVDTGDRLLTPGEVAALFRVDPKTVTRWAAAGRIGSIRTPGGHRRFRESEVRALLEGDGVVEEMREDDAANRPRNQGPSNPGMGYGPPNGLR
jgi:excisionase family DNA binding protein